MPFFGFGPPDVDKMSDRKDMDGLIKALSYKDAYVRWAAAAALGELGAQLKTISLRSRAVDGLSALAMDPIENNMARWNALRALGQVGIFLDEASLLTRAILPLNSALRGSESTLRLTAAEALGNIGSQIFDPALLLWALEPLIQALQDDSPRIREIASRTLVRIGKPGVAVLLPFLQNKHWMVREGVANVLERIGWTPWPDEHGAAYWIVREKWDYCAAIGEAAVKPLIKALKQGNVTNRQEAARVLGKIGDPSIQPLLETLLDWDKEVRLAAADGLNIAGWQPQMDEDGANYWIARQSWSQCIETGEPCLQPLLRCLQDQSEQIRRAVVWSLGKLRPFLPNPQVLTAAVQPLAAALSDLDDAVRQAAADSLAHIATQIQDARQTSTILKILLNVLGDADSAMRRAVADALDLLHWQPPKDRNGALYWAAKQDWQQLEALGLRIAGGLLAELLQDADSAVAGAAAVSLENLGWQPGKDESAAAFWAVREDWPRCIEIGAAALKPLCVTLRCRGAKARRAAAEALGQIASAQKQNADLRSTTVDALIAALDNAEMEVCCSAARALGQIGDSRAIDPMIAVLPLEGLRAVVSEELVRMGLPAVVPLVGALKSPSQNMRDAAAAVLVRIGQPSIRPLLNALQERDSELAEAAAAVLDRLKWQPDRSADGAAYWIVRRRWDNCVTVGAPAVKLLGKLLQEHDEALRQAAVESLGKLAATLHEHAQRSEIAQLLLPVLFDREQLVRFRAALALDETGWKPAKDETSAQYWIVRRKWSHVVQIGAAAVEPLIVALTDREEALRLGAAETLGKIGDARAIKPLTAALKDHKLRGVAAQSLKEIEIHNQ